MLRFAVPQDELRQLCQRYRIDRVAVFGSALRADFHDESDIDVLVTFAPDAARGLLVLVQLGAELSALLGRRVDLGTYDGVLHDPNPYRRASILGSAQVIYAA